MNKTEKISKLPSCNTILRGNPSFRAALVKLTRKYGAIRIRLDKISFLIVFF